jgi:hypothetical protein
VYLMNGCKIALYPEYWHLVKEVTKFKLDEAKLQWEDLSSSSVPVPARRRQPRGKVPTRPGLVIPTNDVHRRPSTSATQKLSPRPHHGFAFSTDPHAGAAEANLMLKPSTLEMTDAVLDDADPVRIIN